ncbi:hypothetical protein Sste5344_000498 [Sporothrix stenoceras]
MSTATAAPHHPPTQPSWCRGASPAVSLFTTRAQRPTITSGANASSQSARMHQQQSPATSRAFGSATMPKQVAFPRHGKAVAPQETPTTTTEKEASTTTEGDTKTPVQQPTTEEVKTAATTEAPSPTEEKKPAKKNGKRTKAAAAAEAKTKEGAAASPSEQSASTVKPASSSETTDSTKTTPSPSSPAADAQKTLGRTDGADSSKIPNDPAGVVAEAAAAATTAAETASAAADILGGASPVIELGPPKVTIGAILEPGQGQGEDQQGQSDQQQQQQQGSGDQASLSSPRQPLSQNKLLPPHLAPPPYVHHFDSYSLVKQLEAGGYKQEQAITAMKAVRSLLAQNLDVAQAGLVSKSDVENEAYLFKAACAELSIEVRNNRRRADELVRQQRTLLQHEVDIAAQSVNQELVTLADVVKELFNDRKMAVREEQKTLESAIQQLSYKITIMLNSEMRSEIEGLRWVLIRRSVLGIIFMAILTLGTLRYASYVSHEKKNAAERALREAHEAEMQRFADTKIDTSAPPDAAEILAAN